MENQVEESLRGELLLASAKVDKLTLELEGLSRKVSEADRKVSEADRKVKFADEKVESMEKKVNSAKQQTKNMKKSRDYHKVKNKELKKKLSDENKKLLSDNKKLSGENEKLLGKLDEKEALKKKGFFGEADCPISRHKYSKMLVKMAVQFIVLCGCSFRQTVKLLQVIHELSGRQDVEVPSFSSVRNWLIKAGYGAYCEAKDGDFLDGFAFIVDASLMIGGQELLLTLGINKTPSGKALSYGDVAVLDMSVKPSWNGEEIGEVLERVATAMGDAPAHVVSDSGSNILSAVKGKNYVHVKDVGHRFALAFEHIYNNDVLFKEMMKKISLLKSTEVMRPTAYLLPPKQRTISRFMNISGVVFWAFKMLQALPFLNEDEQRVFGFLHQYRDLISELHSLCEMTNKILQRLKQKGLSFQTVNESLAEITQLQKSSNKRLIAMGNELSEYLSGEKDKLPTKKTVWHCSSDIIESLFGYYKYHKSPNKMNGVTQQIFLLPLKTAMCSPNSDKKVNIKKFLEQNTLAKIQHWKNTHLPENKTIKRINTLKKIHSNS